MAQDSRNSNEVKYNISLNYRAGTVRVHKKAVDVLGVPKFVQFLINQEARILYMRGINSRDNNCLEVPSAEFRKRNQYTLHGRYFIKKISELANWSLDCPYIIQGEFFPEHNIIVFKLDEAIAYNKPV